ncbi:hypothetical protein PCE1_002275 [Barthelona sp. PCE]
MSSSDKLFERLVVCIDTNTHCIGDKNVFMMYLSSISQFFQTYIDAMRHPELIVVGYNAEGVDLIATYNNSGNKVDFIPLFHSFTTSDVVGECSMLGPAILKACMLASQSDRPTKRVLILSATPPHTPHIGELFSVTERAKARGIVIDTVCVGTDTTEVMNRLDYQVMSVAALSSDGMCMTAFMDQSDMKTSLYMVLSLYYLSNVRNAIEIVNEICSPIFCAVPSCDNPDDMFRVGYLCTMCRSCICHGCLLKHANQNKVLLEPVVGKCPVCNIPCVQQPETDSALIPYHNFTPF